MIVSENQLINFFIYKIKNLIKNHYDTEENLLSSINSMDNIVKKNHLRF